MNMLLRYKIMFLGIAFLGMLLLKILFQNLKQINENVLHSQTHDLCENDFNTLKQLHSKGIRNFFFFFL